MKIVQSDEENIEVMRDFPSPPHRARGRPRKNGNAPHVVKLPADDSAKDELEERSVDTPNDKMMLEKVSASPHRGKGRPRKNAALVSVTQADIESYVKDQPQGEMAGVVDGTQEKASFMSPRGRGRPRKDASDVKAPIAKDPSLPRRGRGRPKKSVDTSEVGNSIGNSKALALPSRGRGRPPKSIKRLDSHMASPAVSTPKRGRGRPKKNSVSLSITKGIAGSQKGSKKLDAVKLLANALSNHERGRPKKGTGIQDAVKLLQKDPAHPKVHSGRLPKSIKRMFAMKLLAKAISPNDTPSRGRGRPRKSDVENKTSPKKSNNFTVEQSPRPRGRPKKILSIPEMEKKGQKTSPRPRGRPKKVLLPPDAAVPSDEGGDSEMESSDEVPEVLSEPESVKSPVIISV